MPVLKPLAEDKGLSLRLENGGGTTWLRSDRMKLARILSNLIGNAIKFTEIGSVTVLCELPQDSGPRVHVTDTGVGIAPDQLPLIFDEFHQLRNPERDRTKGAGLGLAICKRLAEALGCELSVRSEAGRGTTFTLSIPASAVIEPPPAESVAPEQPAPAENDLNGLHVLLVEDHDTTRRAAARLLAAEGATVMQAATGREALHLLAHESPHVLLLDLMLPDLDGSDILRHLQRGRPESLRCVLAVSGDVTELRMAQVKLLGADGLMPKPVDIDRLMRFLKDLSVSRASQPAS